MIQRYIKSILVSLLLAVACQSARADMIFNMYDQNVHDRFDSGAFIGSGFDWTGVGKSGARWATMISPTHFLSADHAHPGVGNTVTFWENNSSAGTTVLRTVAGGERIGTTDLWLGQFDSPVAASIAVYDIAPAATLSTAGMGAYANELTYTVGTRGTLGFAVGQNRFDVVETSPAILGTFEAIGFIQDLSGDTNFIANNETFLQPGDSGGPSFVVDGGALKLAGIHSFIATDVSISDFGPSQEFDYKTSEAWTDPISTRNISFDNFVPSYASQIYALTVPEPTSAAMFGIAMLGLSRRRRLK